MRARRIPTLALRSAIHACIAPQPIPAASLESIFRPLVQLDAGDADPSHARTSLGLGLYIARKIAERHGGAIGVASSQAEGTCFSVSLPISAEDCAQA